MSTIFNETVYLSGNITGQIWYDLSLDPENIPLRVSCILCCADKSSWIIVMGNESTLRSLKIWAMLNRHSFRYSVNKKLCAIKCANMSGVWIKHKAVPELAGLLKKAYDDGDTTISIRYVSKSLLKTKLENN